MATSELARESSVALELHAITPNATNVQQLPDVLQRVALDKQQVGLPARLDHSSITPSKAAGCRRRYSAKRFERGQPGGVHKVVELEVQRYTKDRG
jgi:hypothetical protein